MAIEILEIETGTPLHAQEQRLRDDVLRRPLGRALSATEMERDRLGRHFVAVEDGAVVGCVGLYPEGQGVARLRHMAVAPRLQGRGVGAGLLGVLLDSARVSGTPHIVTHARCTARAFYERAGFIAEGDEFDEQTIPHIRMWKTL